MSRGKITVCALAERNFFLYSKDVEGHTIQNYDALASTPERKLVLSLIDEAFRSIKPQSVMEKHFRIENNTLTLLDQSFSLNNFERVFLIGFGKGSSGIVKIIEDKLGDTLTAGYDIDVVDETFHKVQYTKGTHPLPSQTNIDYTKKVLENVTNLTEKDLVLVVICGGGSVLFEAPFKIDLETLTATNKALLMSGATISEMNVIRKHLSSVKGGGLAKHLYPATVASLIFSDVPGNDLSVIASAPTVKDPTTMEMVKEIVAKYKIKDTVHLTDDSFTETPTEDMYFEKVHNLMFVSNLTALHAMQEKAKALGYEAIIHSDKMQGDAKTIGQEVLQLAQAGKIILIGGETTVKVTGNGKGGRNQALVLGALPFIADNTLLASFDSDGWDFYELAGAIGDRHTVEKAEKLGLAIKAFLDNDDSYTFFDAVGDGIKTGKLESNVSDLIVIFKPRGNNV